MTTRHRILLTALLGVALVVTACGGATPASMQTQGSGGADATGPTPVPNPDTPAASAGSDDGDIGGGSGPGVLDPGKQPVLVAPAPNVRDIHDVGATTLDATVDGRRVTARLTWWSGVEPCTALAGIDIARDDREITLTIREGSAAALDVMCTAQVIAKAAIVDLGELESGTWTIRAAGEAPPVEVTVQG